MTALPFEKRSRKSLLIGTSLIAIGFLTYYSTLKSDADLVAEMPAAMKVGIKSGMTASLISLDAEKPCDGFQPTWLAIVKRASEKKSARLAAEITARSFVDLATESNQTDDIKYKCLQATVEATAGADQNLREGVLLRKMRKITAEQLAFAAPNDKAQVEAKANADRISAETAKIEEMKTLIKSAQTLTGQMIRQKEKGVYEITDSKGRPGVLKTSKTFFQKKGAFSISARNVQQIEVKLSESEGGFDTTRFVWEETTNLKDLEKNITASRAEIVRLKKSIAANDSKEKLANKRRSAQIKKAFEAIVAEYDGLTGRSIQEMSAN